MSSAVQTKRVFLTAMAAVTLPAVSGCGMMSGMMNKQSNMVAFTTQL